MGTGPLLAEGCRPSRRGEAEVKWWAAAGGKKGLSAVLMRFRGGGGRRLIGVGSSGLARFEPAVVTGPWPCGAISQSAPACWEVSRQLRQRSDQVERLDYCGCFDCLRIHSSLDAIQSPYAQHRHGMLTYHQPLVNLTRRDYLAAV